MSTENLSLIVIDGGGLQSLRLNPCWTSALPLDQYQLLELVFMKALNVKNCSEEGDVADNPRKKVFI